MHVRRSELAMVNAANAKWPLKNDAMVRVARGEKAEFTPVWLFRQAGRHLPEYNEYKTKNNKNFLQLLDDPEDVCEVTMQPVRRYNLDAAILFSDILVVAEVLGIEVTMPGGKGIQVPKPLRDPEDIARIPEKIDVNVGLSHVIAAVSRIKEELKGKVPLIGFSAAPWTLLFYMVGGSSLKNVTEGERWLTDYPAASERLMDILTEVIIDYLEAQAKAGADILQVFEAMGGFISPAHFKRFALPRMVRIAKELKIRCPDVPLMVFPRGAEYALADLQQAGYNVVTLGTAVDRTTVRSTLRDAANGGTAAVVQGNFDPKLLVRREDITIEEQKAEVREATRAMLIALEPHALIANLGEGLSGKEDTDLVACFVDAVHDISAAMIGLS